MPLIDNSWAQYGKTIAPATNLPHGTVEEEGWRGIHSHFHKPTNEHNRFMANVPERDRIYYRNIERPSPYNVGATMRTMRLEHQLQQQGLRPSTAPGDISTSPMHAATGRSLRMPGSPVQLSPDTLAQIRVVPLGEKNATATGAPVFGVQAVVEADMVDGTVFSDGGDEWRRARVVTYEVPTARYGYAEAGARAYTQDYRHYKYYGYAGKGAKTSWAANPKQMIVFPGRTGSPTIAATQELTAGGTQRSPLQETVGGPRRPLTAVEKQLVREFRGHSLDPAAQAEAAEAEASQSPQQAARSRKAGGGRKAQQQHQLTHSADIGMVAHATAAAAVAAGAAAEVLDPYVETVRLQEPGAVSRHDAAALPRYDVAKVTTYRHPASSVYRSTNNPSPQHGSQTPFTLRYNHYKYNGFAGRGASTSWARNPKYAQLYDN